MDTLQARERQDLVGDWVWFSTKILLSTQSIQKAGLKVFGLFPVNQQINPVAFHLQLPASLKVHPVFHQPLLVCEGHSWKILNLRSLLCYIIPLGFFPLNPYKICWLSQPLILNVSLFFVCLLYWFHGIQFLSFYKWNTGWVKEITKAFMQPQVQWWSHFPYVKASKWPICGNFFSVCLSV